MFHLIRFLEIFLLISSALSVPLQQDDAESGDAVTEPSNETSQNLYVIRSVVYEIGILTDSDDDSDPGNETHEQVDVSFFDPGHNGSIIDLSNIPLPVQANISGVAVTGILPADLGQINLNENGTATLNGTSFPIFPNRQIKVTHNISTVDKDKTSAIIASLPKILGLDDVLKTASTTITDAKEDGENEDYLSTTTTATSDIKLNEKEKGELSVEPLIPPESDEKEAR